MTGIGIMSQLKLVVWLTFHVSFRHLHDYFGDRQKPVFDTRGSNRRGTLGGLA